MWNALPETWTSSHTRYPSALKARATLPKRADLPSHDTYLWTHLPSLIASRTPPHITSSEYSRLVRWKLQRGKFRPRLQAYADVLTDSEVIPASTAAFSALEDRNVRNALRPLLLLRGCGPATASAVLAAADTSVPFMSDELLLAADGERRYTVPVYLRLIDRVRAKAASLSKQAKGLQKWTARDVECAVFAAENYDPGVVDADGEAAMQLALFSAPGTGGSDSILEVGADELEVTREMMANKPEPMEPSVSPKADAPTFGARRSRSSLGPSSDAALSPRRSKRKRAS